jgi:hypothetical protein
MTTKIDHGTDDAEPATCLLTSAPMSAFDPKRTLIATFEAVHAVSNARSSTRKLGARLSPRLRALVDRFAKSRDGGSDHSVLSWAVPLMKRVDKQLFFMTALIAFERAPIGD